MWTTLEKIYHPRKADAALRLLEQSGTRILGGGTYLLAERDPTIHALVDLSQILSDTVRREGGDLVCGAGATLTDLLEQKPENPFGRAVAGSCPSPQIRNQRTLGGEIARNRPDSDLLVLLHVVDTRIQLLQGKTVTLGEWDGSGVIESVLIPNSMLDRAGLVHLSLLPSAPAYLLLAVIPTPEGLQIALGGQMSRIVKGTLARDGSVAEVKWTMDLDAVILDHVSGSTDYRKQVLNSHLTRLREDLCP